MTMTPLARGLLLLLLAALNGCFKPETRLDFRPAPLDAGAPVESISHPLVGRPAPLLEEVDLEGTPFSLAELRGKAVLLGFWATF